MAKKNYTKEFLKRFGSGAVKKVKRRAPIDTGALRADINYKVKETKTGFDMKLYIDNHLIPKDSKILPSVYGKILDEFHGLKDRTKGGETFGWFSDPIMGYSKEDFIKQATIAVKKDLVSKIKK